MSIYSNSLYNIIIQYISFYIHNKKIQKVNNEYKDIISTNGDILIFKDNNTFIFNWRKKGYYQYICIYHINLKDQNYFKLKNKLPKSYSL